MPSVKCCSDDLVSVDGLLGGVFLIVVGGESATSIAMFDSLATDSSSADCKEPKMDLVVLRLSPRVRGDNGDNTLENIETDRISASRAPYRCRRGVKTS